MLKRAYVEITNVCNLRCAFCPGTKRAKRFLSPDEFALVLDRLRAYTSYVYLHVMGEPLLHPQLSELLSLTQDRGMHVCITTNGTLLGVRANELLASPALYKVCVSLHCIEENGGNPANERAYLETIWAFAVCATARGIFVALRLWNEGAIETRNSVILDFLREKTGTIDWPRPRANSFRLADNLYLERKSAFLWPDLDADETAATFCLALREQIAVLVDGTVVPCCLDHEGTLALGNLFTQELSAILSSERARAIYEGFSRHRPAEPLCRRCNYAVRFNR